MLARWSFDFYSSLPFWGAVVAAAVLVRLLGKAPALRRLALLACSAALLLAIPGFGLRGLLLLWSITAFSFVVARLLLVPALAEHPARRRWIAGAGVVGVLAILAFFKYRFLQDLVLFRSPGTPHAPSDYLSLLGISYFTFKSIHVIVECSKQEITRVDALTYVDYLSFFPAFISGPINRFKEFAAQLEAGAPSPLGPDLRAGLERIIHGLFKKFVLVPIVFPYVLSSRTSSFGELVLGLYAYAFYFYFDFSGYSDLALGSARLLGVTLPENFRWPFLQKNIRDLWTNWHMSLTAWLVDYIYWPLVRALRNWEYFRTRPLLLSMVGMNVTFVACGIWHGESPHFVVWGAYHGLGISALQLYQRQVRKLRNRGFQRWLQSRTARALAMFLTFNFFAVGLALFVLDLGSLGAVLGRVFH